MWLQCDGDDKMHAGVDHKTAVLYASSDQASPANWQRVPESYGVIVPVHINTVILLPSPVILA
jgi:hypothetical protein